MVGLGGHVVGPVVVVLPLHGVLGLDLLQMAPLLGLVVIGQPVEPRVSVHRLNL